MRRRSAQIRPTKAKIGLIGCAIISAKRDGVLRIPSFVLLALALLIGVGGPATAPPAAAQADDAEALGC
jgi:hypothetical protein